MQWYQAIWLKCHCKVTVTWFCVPFVASQLTQARVASKRRIHIHSTRLHIWTAHFYRLHMQTSLCVIWKCSLSTAHSPLTELCHKNSWKTARSKQEMQAHIQTLLDKHKRRTERIYKEWITSTDSDVAFHMLSVLFWHQIHQVNDATKSLLNAIFKVHFYTLWVKRKSVEDEGAWNTRSL